MQTRRPTIPTLDGWRGAAVLGVILYHGRSELFTHVSLFQRLATHGNLGVDLFFAISGFLICGLLLEEHRSTHTIDLRRFYLRRCFRILPAYYAALAGILLVSASGAITVNTTNLQSCLLFYRNYRPLGIDEQHGFYTAHFWSLALEEHFYLVWPVLLAVVKPKRAGAAAFLGAVAVLAWRTAEEHFQLLPHLLLPANLPARTDTRVDALLWGCLAAIYLPAAQRLIGRLRFRQLWLPIAAVLLAMEATHAPGLFFWRSVLLPALLLATVLQPDSLLSRVLEWKLLRRLGAVSYSLYLWQELFLPEIASEKALGAFRTLQRPPWNFAAMLLLAVLSRYLLEQPMIRLGRRFTDGRTPAGPPQADRAGRATVHDFPIPGGLTSDQAFAPRYSARTLNGSSVYPPIPAEEAKAARQDAGAA